MTAIVTAPSGERIRTDAGDDMAGSGIGTIWSIDIRVSIREYVDPTFQIWLADTVLPRLMRSAICHVEIVR